MKLTAATTIRCELAALRHRTEAPEQHVRWDLRFTDIQYLPRPNPQAPQRFRYATRIGFGVAIEGWGETVGRDDGCGSALRFGSDDRKSLIREGAGCWSYRPNETAVDFRTIYDYRARYGPLGRWIDRLTLRPLLVWATRWSFDRLRLWIERGLEPDLAMRLWLTKLVTRTLLGFVWIYEGLVPKLLALTPGEVALVARSRLYWPTPLATILSLAVAEILGGIWLLSGRRERAAALISTLALCLLGLLVSVNDFAVLTHPYGGLSKNLGLIACGIVVFALSPVTPRAARASRPKGTS